MKSSKRQKLIIDKVGEAKTYPLKEAVEVCQSMPKVKFNETVDISINLGVDPKKVRSKCKRIVFSPSWGREDC